MQECELLKRLRPLFPGNGGDIVAGIGDDAAIVKFGNRLLLAAVDQLIGGIHYLQLATPAAVAGAKLLKRNLSDIAAMGGKPDWALLTIAANAVLINGEGQPFRDVHAIGRIVDWGEKSGVSYVKTDLTAAYPTLTRYIRIFRLSGRTVTVTDEIEFFYS